MSASDRETKRRLDCGTPKALYRDEGVVLRTQKLGEADRIITVLTRRHGKVRAVAKGVRRTKSKFGARLEPFSHVDLQLYTGRTSTSSARPSRPGLRPRRRRRLPRLHRGTAVLETADRLTAEEREPSLRLFLLVIGACGRWPSDPPGRAGAGRVPAAGHVGGRLGAGAVGDCARCGEAGSAPALLGAGRRHRSARLPADRLGEPNPVTIELLEALLSGDWARPRRASRHNRREGSGLVAALLQWHLERGLRSLRAGGPREHRRRKQYRPPNPHPVRARPARRRDPGRQGAPARGDRHGRQRPVGQGARAAAHRRARGGGGLAVRLRRGRHRARHRGDQRLRLLHRELAAQPRGGPLPHGLQPRRDPPPPRRDARARACGCAGPGAGRGCGAA